MEKALMAGRPPKPTALKILQGNPGHRPLNADEPKPTVGAAAPARVRRNARYYAKWKELAPRLERCGILTEIDADALGMLCILEVGVDDMIEAAAAASTLATVSKELRALWARFGMTPADRARVKVEKQPPASKLSRFISGPKR